MRLINLKLLISGQKLLSMKLVSRKVIFNYLYNQLTGNFAGFLIGMSATSLVSNFFETRSLRNIWGLTSKKTVVDKETYSNLEWIISIVIGFMVFEIFTKVLKERIVKNLPTYQYTFYRWIVAHQWHTKLRNAGIILNHRRSVLFAAMNITLKNTISKYSKR